jgi:hypothetical protein
MESKEIAPPEDLGAAGIAEWKRIVSVYTLRPDELMILWSACKARDLHARVESEWIERGCPMMTKGSMGQEVKHPLFAGQESLLSQVATITARLKLPDLPAGDPIAQPNQHRSAAQSKWSAEHGKGA